MLTESHLHNHQVALPGNGISILPIPHTLQFLGLDALREAEIYTPGKLRFRPVISSILCLRSSLMEQS